MIISCDLLKIHYLCGWNDNVIKKGAIVEGLWFAQNSLPLWLKWQQTQKLHVCRCRCDLLKIHYLCGWNDNIIHKTGARGIVVICSKFITFVVEMTTNSFNVTTCNPLWFAQNSLPLWLKWQLDVYWQRANSVVICSKFITFVVEMTTYYTDYVHNKLLWFAQNSLPLWLKWQLEN